MTRTIHKSPLEDYEVQQAKEQAERKERLGIDPRDTRRYSLANEPINPDMGEGRIQDAYRRMMDRIADGLPLHSEDSTYPGDKYTHCSWGMCSPDREQWPEADDHVWPEDFKKSGRVAPRRGATCPLGRDSGTEVDRVGCFYRCMVFKAKTPLSREVALERYDQALIKREAANGQQRTEMDDEPWREL